jgi:hypothetical protein
MSGLARLFKEADRLTEWPWAIRRPLEGTVIATERYCERSARGSAPRDPAPPASWPLRGFGGGGGMPSPTEWRIP